MNEEEEQVKTKCENCTYYYLEKDNNKSYGFCCLYLQDVDRCVILNLCTFIDKD